MSARRLPAVLLALALAGCGSTVQVSSTRTTAPDQATTGSTGGGLTSTTGTSTGGASGSTSGITAGSGTASTGGTTGTTGASSTTGGSTSGSAGSASSGTTGGVTRKDPIRIGLMYVTGADQAASAMGISGLTTGDTVAQTKAVVDYVNAHGGLAGRKVQLYSYGISTSDNANNPDAAMNTACAALTQDDKVRFVVTILNVRPAAVPCFAKRGVGIIGDQMGLGDSSTKPYGSFLAAPGELAGGRAMKVLVDDLWKRGWLTKTSKVGSFTYDDANGKALVTGPLTAALKAHGLSLTKDERVSNDAGAINQAAGASFRFRAAGVDRIIPVLASPLFLMNAASSQGYHPAYAMYSSFGPGFLEGTAPKDQLANSAGIGWQPLLDIGAGTKHGPVSSRETLCFDLMAKAGQGSTNATVKALQVQVCNTVFYLQEAANALPAIPNDLLAQSRPALGNRFVPSDTFRVDVTSRVDGVAAYRPLAFQQACSCYQYVGPVTATP